MVNIGYNEEIINIILEHGSDILDDSRFEKEKEFIQHGTTTTFDHSLCVTYLSVWMAQRSRHNINMRSVVRSALLHDYFLYDWHEPTKANRIHGFTHPGIALNNAEKVFHLGKIEKNMIKRHMFPLTPVPPKYRESVILCVADKICATKETVGGFKTKLMKKMAKNKYRRNGNDA